MLGGGCGLDSHQQLGLGGPPRGVLGCPEPVPSLSRALVSLEFCSALWTYACVPYPPLQKATATPGRKSRGRPKKLVGHHRVKGGLRTPCSGHVECSSMREANITHVEAYLPLQRSLVSRKFLISGTRYGPSLGPREVSCAHTPFTRSLMARSGSEGLDRESCPIWATPGGCLLDLFLSCQRQDDSLG